MNVKICKNIGENLGPFAGVYGTYDEPAEVADQASLTAYAPALK